MASVQQHREQPRESRIAGEDQAPIVAFLQSGDAFGNLPVERVDTHLSHIFLAGNRAYKLKRSVRLPFADFSTPEKRRAACEHEIAVNRMFPSDLYLDVVPIVRRNGGYRLGGDGSPVDWLVAMQRFDRRNEFDRLAERNELSELHIERLADIVAAQHLGAAREFDSNLLLPLRKTVADLGQVLKDQATDEPLAAPVAQWNRAAREVVHLGGPKLDLRRRHGFVRHCHGDLHLANVCLVNGEPTPFDAIEFNDAFATIDVLYDAAFTVMDLLHHGKRSLANRFLNRYLSATEDYCGLGLFPLFMSVRAAVRGMAALLAAQPSERNRDAGALIALANDLLEICGRPRLVAVGGLSGTGKSSLAKLLALDLAPGTGAVVLRSDVIRKRLAGVAPEQALPSESYTHSMSRRVYRHMVRLARQALAAEQTVILDAVFLQEDEREQARRAADAMGCPFEGLWLETKDRSMLEDRLVAREGDASDATPAVLRSQVERDVGGVNWVRIDAGQPPDQVRLRSLEHLDGRLTARWPNPVTRD